MGNAGTRRTDRVGFGIAKLFTVGGWGIAILGAGMAAYGAYAADDMTARVGALLPGLAVAVFGIFSVLIAVQTRAALETAEMTREMLVLVRRQTGSLPSRPPAEGPIRQANRDVVAPEPEQPSRPGDGAMSGTSGKAAPIVASRLGPPPKSGAVARKVHPIFTARPPR